MHILCGVDESAGGQSAANVAALLAHRMGAQLTLVRVVAMTPGSASARGRVVTPLVDLDRTGAAAASAQDELDALADDIAAAFGARPDVSVVHGDNPAEELRAVARALEGNLIVIGAPARSRFAGVLRAGTRAALLRTADCPVMVVPAGAAPPIGDGVAVAHETGASTGAATVAARLASALDASLTVIHVLADPRSYTRPALPMYHAVRRGLAAADDGDELDVRHVGAYRLPAAHLAHTVAEVRPALVVVAAPRQATWRHRLRPSVSAQLLRRARCPVVVVPEGAAVRASKPMLVGAA